MNSQWPRCPEHGVELRSPKADDEHDKWHCPDCDYTWEGSR